MKDRENGSRSNDEMVEAIAQTSAEWPLPKIDALKKLAQVNDASWSVYGNASHYLISKEIIGEKAEIKGRAIIVLNPRELAVVEAFTRSKNGSVNNKYALEAVIESNNLDGERLEKARELHARYSE